MDYVRIEMIISSSRTVHDSRITKSSWLWQQTGESEVKKSIEAEDIKEYDDETKEMMRVIFNEIMK